MAETKFQWDQNKNIENQEKHGVAFSEAQYAFYDPKRIIAEDTTHSQNEKRYFCFGVIDDAVVTVRFTYRGNTIRIFGAGFWRKGKNIYEKENKI